MITHLVQALSSTVRCRVLGVPFVTSHPSYLASRAAASARPAAAFLSSFLVIFGASEGGRVDDVSMRVTSLSKSAVLCCCQRYI